ncbi:MAG: bifunctional methylenetetrahydrofolate dehydrogenase/methenyltetrahydrofolate cyclohydrolase FolD [Myxococcota bacterium]
MPNTLVIDGKDLAQKVRSEIKRDVEAITSTGRLPPHLVVVLASDDPASAVYVRGKGRAADQVGIRSTQHTLPADTSAADLLNLIDRLNADPDVDGILVQLPLPSQHDEEAVIRRIDPSKDVDGLNPANAGRLARGDEDCLMPCTPLGCIRLIEEAGTDFKGAKATVIGRSRLVGRPVADLLLNRHATVTVCHSRTADLADACRQADIVVAAVGRRRFVQADWIKPGATVIDVGINRNEEGKLEGDVDFEAVRPVAKAITPVPKGVGPMTITYLLSNTVKAAQSRRSTAQTA